MKKNGFYIAIIILLLIIIGLGGYYIINQNKTKTVSDLVTIPSPTLSIPTQPPVVFPQEEVTEEETIPVGWSTYKSTVYGFQISYPASFKALDDSDNLYGWPNGVVLLYKGGQSYDIAIEVWDSQAEYESKYQTSDIEVLEINGKFITVANITNEAESEDIIATFSKL